MSSLSSPPQRPKVLCTQHPAVQREREREREREMVVAVNDEKVEGKLSLKNRRV